LAPAPPLPPAELPPLPACPPAALALLELEPPAPLPLPPLPPLLDEDQVTPLDELLAAAVSLPSAQPLVGKNVAVAASPKVAANKERGIDG
jgi:hypothetical protein